MGIGLDIDPSIRIVTHEETFDDLAVRELAKGRAACICRLQYGRCKANECKTCVQAARFKNCYNQMNDYNKERLGSYIGDYYQAYSVNATGWKSFKYLVIETIVYLFVILMLLVLPLLIWFCGKPGQQPVYWEVPQELDRKIVYCVQYSQSQVFDRNMDKKVNCVDYAVTFKEQWDKMYPASKDMCEVIRNKHGNFHHLFIGVIYKGRYIFVEPWAYDPEMYLMVENWDRRYDPRYNIYGETSKWMKKIVR